MVQDSMQPASPGGLVQRALQTGAYDVVVEALQRCHELGLGRMSGVRYSYVLTGLARAEQLDALLRCAA